MPNYPTAVAVLGTSYQPPNKVVLAVPDFYKVSEEIIRYVFSEFGFDYDAEPVHDCFSLVEAVRRLFTGEGLEKFWYAPVYLQQHQNHDTQTSFLLEMDYVSYRGRRPQEYSTARFTSHHSVDMVDVRVFQLFDPPEYALSIEQIASRHWQLKARKEVTLMSYVYGIELPEARVADVIDNALYLFKQEGWYFYYDYDYLYSSAEMMNEFLANIRDLADIYGLRSDFYPFDVEWKAYTRFTNLEWESIVRLLDYIAIEMGLR